MVISSILNYDMKMQQLLSQASKCFRPEKITQVFH